MNVDEILKKIEKIIPNSATFNKRIIEHIKTEHFPLIYQSLYEHINHHQESEEFKTLLLKQHYLEIINDVYRTRLSKKGVELIKQKLEEVSDFKKYNEVIEKFAKCNFSNKKKKKPDKDAFSLGTKVLHTFNPDENPILDSVIRKQLKLGNIIDSKLYRNFREAMNNFVVNNPDCFSKNNLKKLNNEFKKYNLKPDFPKMKLLDMALYEK